MSRSFSAKVPVSTVDAHFDDLKSALLPYFRGEGIFAGLGLASLSANYDWPKRGRFPDLPQLSEYFRPGMSNFEKTVLMRQVSESIWRSGNWLELTIWVVSKWGGIRSNSLETLNRYVYDYSLGREFRSFAGASSYSKMLAFARPTDFPIYDARVAISLNVLQSLSVLNSRLFFAVGPSQNSIIMEKRIVFREELTADSGWSRIDLHQVYKEYRVLLSRISAELNDVSIWELEMALFADAEKLITLESSENDKASRFIYSA